jgi:hypothetical protein
MSADVAPGEAARPAPRHRCDDVVDAGKADGLHMARRGVRASQCRALRRGSGQPIARALLAPSPPAPPLAIGGGADRDEAPSPSIATASERLPRSRPSRSVGRTPSSAVLPGSAPEAPRRSRGQRRASPRCLVAMGAEEKGFRRSPMKQDRPRFSMPSHSAEQVVVCVACGRDSCGWVLGEQTAAGRSDDLRRQPCLRKGLCRPSLSRFERSKSASNVPWRARMSRVAFARRGDTGRRIACGHRDRAIGDEGP